MSFSRTTALAVALLGATAAPAFAHPHLLSSSPAANADVPPPARLVLRFSEPLVAKFSGAEVIEINSQTRLPVSNAVDRKDAKVLTVRLPGYLSPGAYTVQWHAVSKDTHRLTGKYDFTVR